MKKRSVREAITKRYAFQGNAKNIIWLGGGYLILQITISKKQINVWCTSGGSCIGETKRIKERKLDVNKVRFGFNQDFGNKWIENFISSIK